MLTLSSKRFTRIFARQSSAGRSESTGYSRLLYEAFKARCGRRFRAHGFGRKQTTANLTTSIISLSDVRL